MSKKSTPTVRTYIRYANDRRTQPTHLVIVRREIPGGPHRAAAVPLDNYTAPPTGSDDVRVESLHSVCHLNWHAGDFDLSWRIGADYGGGSLRSVSSTLNVDKDFLSSAYLHRRCIPIELSTEEVMRLCPALAQWAWPEMGAQPVGNVVNFDEVPANSAS